MPPPMQKYIRLLWAHFVRPLLATNKTNSAGDTDHTLQDCYSNILALPSLARYDLFARRDIIVFGYPEQLSIFSHTKCNLRCFICRRESYKGETMDFNQLHALEKAIRFAKRVDLTGWGEPFTYPRLEDALKHIFAINPGEIIFITTNGTSLRNATQNARWPLELHGDFAERCHAVHLQS